MKAVQHKVLLGYSALIAGLMTVLGFASSCVPWGRAEYGTPHARFIVKGKVTAAGTEEPIRGIRVILPGDTAYTGTDGKYEVSNDFAFPTDQNFDLLFQDRDGDAHGAFQDLDTIVKFTNPKFTGGDGDWDEGSTSTNFDVELTPKP